MVHAKQGVIPGRMTLACPLKPSVPPSTRGFTVERSTFPSSSCSRKLQAVSLIHALASTESSPSTMI